MTVTVKGAPERILDFCEYMNIDGENQKIDKQKILYQNNQLAGEGFRVIGVAKLNENSLEIKKEYNENDIKGLTF